MNGDFRPDITRDTFRLHRHFSRVLMQQGRVQLDSDWNEQIDILLRYMRTFIADIVGRCGGPDEGFALEAYRRIEHEQEKTRRGKQKDAEAVEKDVPYHFLVHQGHYYVDGILCENDEEDFVFSIHPSLRPASPQTGQTQRGEERKEEQRYLLYLDVWEREVTPVEDPFIREVALGGPDTTTRAQVVWRVRAVRLEELPDCPDPKDHTKEGDENVDLPGFKIAWTKYLQHWKAARPALMRAQVMEAEQASKEPCAISPTSHYRGLENQLYRVEIHGGSHAEGGPTFKWSRENGAVVFPITGSLTGGHHLTSLTVTLGNLGRDDHRFGLHVDDWVEIVDCEEALEGEPGPIMRVEKIQYATRTVTLVSATDHGVTLESDHDPERTLFLRKWNYRESDPGDRHAPQIGDSGGLKIVNGWLTLEDGIEILFDDDNGKLTYRSGDYWLIPARTATGKIEWPHRHDQPEALEPHGIRHFHAPLAYVILEEGCIKKKYDLRCVFQPLCC